MDLEALNNGWEIINLEPLVAAPTSGASNAQIWFESDGLHFQDNSNERIITFAGSDTLTDLTITSDDTPSIFITETTGTVTTIIQSTNTLGRLGTTTNDDLEVITNNTTALTISAGQLATFAGDVTISNAAPNLTITDSTTPTTFEIAGADTSFALGTTTAHSLFLKTNNATAVTIASGGAVTLVDDLTVQGDTLTITNAGTPYLNVTETDGTITARIGSDGSTGILGTSTNHSLIIQTNSTTALTIDTTQLLTISGKVTSNKSLTSTSSAERIYYVDVNVEAVSNSSANMRALQMDIDTATTDVNYTGELQGFLATASHRRAGTVSALEGAKLIAQNASTSTGVVTGLYGVRSQVANISATGGTVGTAYAMFVDSPVTTGTITNIYGLYISSISGGATLNYAIKTNAGLVEFGDDVYLDSILTMLADQTTDVAPNDDTTRKKFTIQKLAAPPTNAAYIPFQNNPGTDTFYMVMEEG